MKKTFLTLFLMTTMFGAAYADGREKPTSVDKLPQAAQEFLSAHFKDLTVAYAVEEQKYTGKEYEVVYTDRTEVEFRSDGQWESVGRKYSPVPASIVPQPIPNLRFRKQLSRAVHPSDRPQRLHVGGGVVERFGDQIRQSIQRYRHRRLSIEYTNRVIVIAAFGSGVVGHGLRWTKTVGCIPH